MTYMYADAKTVVGKPLVDDGKGNYKGECVSLVKKYVPTLPQTSKWKMGGAVRGKKVAEGTVIATFLDDKNYKGKVTESDNIPVRYSEGNER